jgi:site-specific recombinase XerD
MARINNGIDKLVQDYLSKRQYSSSTIEVYSMWMVQLTDYYSDIPPYKISENQLKEFINFLLTRKKLSIHSIHQAAHAFITIFNKLYKKSYKIESLSLPYRNYALQEVLTSDEIIDILNNAPSLKSKFAFSILYSAGLLVGELKQIRLADFDVENRKITIRNKSGRVVRKAIMSEYIAKEYEVYKEKYETKKWLFEGKKAGIGTSSDVIQRAFRHTLLAAGITKPVSLKNLKYSYVQHLCEQGLPLHSVLSELKMASHSKRTYAFYSRIVTGRDNIVVEHSPLDKIIYSNEVSFINTKPLERLLFRISDASEADYLNEAITCIKVGAFRACVVFAWNAAMRNIHNRCINHSNHLINNIVKKHEPTARNIKKIEDFAYLKDRTVLLLSMELGEFDKNQKDILESCLLLRNKSGHPGNYKPQSFKVAGFLEDLITIVFT